MGLLGLRDWLGSVYRSRVGWSIFMSSFNTSCLYRLLLGGRACRSLYVVLLYIVWLSD